MSLCFTKKIKLRPCLLCLATGPSAPHSLPFGLCFLPPSPCTSAQALLICKPNRLFASNQTSSFCPEGVEFCAFYTKSLAALCAACVALQLMHSERLVRPGRRVQQARLQSHVRFMWNVRPAQPMRSVGQCVLCSVCGLRGLRGLFAPSGLCVRLICKSSAFCLACAHGADSASRTCCACFVALSLHGRYSIALELGTAPRSVA